MLSGTAPDIVDSVLLKGNETAILAIKVDITADPGTRPLVELSGSIKARTVHADTHVSKSGSGAR